MSLQQRAAADAMDDAPAEEEPSKRRPSQPPVEDALPPGSGLAAALVVGVASMLFKRVFRRRSGSGSDARASRRATPPGDAPGEGHHVSHFRARDLPPAPGVVAAWSVAAVCEFLAHIGLSQYAPAFEDNAVDGAMLLSLTAEDLAELGVAHRLQRVRPVRPVRCGRCGAKKRGSVARSETRVRALPGRQRNARAAAAAARRAHCIVGTPRASVRRRSAAARLRAPELAPRRPTRHGVLTRPACATARPRRRRSACARASRPRRRTARTRRLRRCAPQPRLAAQRCSAHEAMPAQRFRFVRRTQMRQSPTPAQCLTRRAALVSSGALRRRRGL
jgi:hypothetical protein